jgi:hypothetical protein
VRFLHVSAHFRVNAGFRTRVTPRQRSLRYSTQIGFQREDSGTQALGGSRAFTVCPAINLPELDKALQANHMKVVVGNQIEDR